MQIECIQDACNIQTGCDSGEKPAAIATIGDDQHMGRGSGIEQATATGLLYGTRSNPEPEPALGPAVPDPAVRAPLTLTDYIEAGHWPEATIAAADLSSERGFRELLAAFDTLPERADGPGGIIEPRSHAFGACLATLAGLPADRLQHASPLLRSAVRQIGYDENGKSRGDGLGNSIQTQLLNVLGRHHDHHACKQLRKDLHTALEGGDNDGLARGLVSTLAVDHPDYMLADKIVFEGYRIPEALVPRLLSSRPLSFFNDRQDLVRLWADHVARSDNPNETPQTAKLTAGLLATRADELYPATEEQLALALAKFINQRGSLQFKYRDQVVDVAAVALNAVMRNPRLYATDHGAQLSGDMTDPHKDSYLWGERWESACRQCLYDVIEDGAWDPEHHWTLIKTVNTHSPPKRGSDDYRRLTAIRKNHRQLLTGHPGLEKLLPRAR